MKTKFTEMDLHFLALIKEGVIKVTKQGKTFKIVAGKQVRIGSIGTNGYNHITFKNKDIREHRLVYIVFKGVIPENLVINHKNGIKTDNRLSNLELVTLKENSQHAHDTGSYDYTYLHNNRGHNHPRCKLTPKDVEKIRKLHVNNWSDTKIAEKFDVSRQLINAIINNKLYTDPILDKKVSKERLPIKPTFPKTNSKDVISVVEKEILKMVIQDKLRVTKSGKVFNMCTNKRIGIGLSSEKGYCRIYVRCRNKYRGMLVHRLVHLVHKGPIPKNYVVHHKNGIKTDNRIVNLEVVTVGQNNQHAYDSNTIDRKNKSEKQRGENNPSSRLTSEIVLVIRKMYETGDFTQQQIANKFNTSRAYISKIVNRKVWTHI